MSQAEGLVWHVVHALSSLVGLRKYLLRQRSPFTDEANDDNDDNADPAADDANLTLPAAEVPFFYARLAVFLSMTLGVAWAAMTLILLLPALVGQPVLALLVGDEDLTDIVALAMAIGVVWVGVRLGLAVASTNIMHFVRAALPTVLWLVKVVPACCLALCVVSQPAL